MDDGNDMAKNMSPGRSATFFHTIKELSQNMHSEIMSNFERIQKKKTKTLIQPSPLILGLKQILNN